MTLCVCACVRLFACDRGCVCVLLCAFDLGCVCVCYCCAGFALSPSSRLLFVVNRLTPVRVCVCARAGLTRAAERKAATVGNAISLVTKSSFSGAGFGGGKAGGDAFALDEIVAADHDAEGEEVHGQSAVDAVSVCGCVLCVFACVCMCSVCLRACVHASDSLRDCECVLCDCALV